MVPMVQESIQKYDSKQCVVDPKCCSEMTDSLGPGLKNGDSNCRALCKYNIFSGYQWDTKYFFSPKPSVPNLQRELWVFALFCYREG